MISRHSGLTFVYPIEHLPCVTKLPKFLPTTQCHVAPLRESNCGIRERRESWEPTGPADLFLDVLGDILGSLSTSARTENSESAASYLLNVVFIHRLDR